MKMKREDEHFFVSSLIYNDHENSNFDNMLIGQRTYETREDLYSLGRSPDLHFRVLHTGKFQEWTRASRHAETWTCSSHYLQWAPKPVTGVYNFFPQLVLFSDVSFGDRHRPISGWISTDRLTSSVAFNYVLRNCNGLHVSKNLTQARARDWKYWLRVFFKSLQINVRIAHLYVKGK